MVVNAVFVAKLLPSGILFSTIVNAVFVAKLATPGILFSTAVNEVSVAKLLISGILPFISMILVLQLVFLTRPLVSGILFSNFDLSVSYLVFKTNPLVSILFTLATNLFYTSRSLNFYLNLQEQALIYQYLIYQLQFLK